MGKSNNFKKEYVTGRKDQYDLDYTIFRKCVEETETREGISSCVQSMGRKGQYQSSLQS